MSREQEKLKAALDVVGGSILHGWTPESYVEYVKAIMPDDYSIKWNGKGISCISKIGLYDEDWEYISNAIKQRIGDKFQEIYHNTNFNHKDFIIYIKQNK